jgi:hypothetical protein
MSDQVSGPIVAPQGPWDPGREPFSLNGLLKGRKNVGLGAIDTEHQQMSGALRMTAFQLQSQSKSWNFYSVFGSMTHGVSHKDSNYTPGPNWVSVGYYATAMSLKLDLVDGGTGAEIWDSGPTSTVGSNSTGFSIGGNLSGGTFGGEPILSAGVNGGFSASFASPDVTFATSQVANSVQWNVALPGVGFVSPGVPANPHEPSYAGYKFYFGAIYALPKASTFKLSITPSIRWEFDYTRGITNDVKVWSYSKPQLFNFQGAKDALPA